MKIDVKHIAKLANLQVSNEEEKKFEVQLGETLSYIEMLQEVDTNNVKATNQVTGLENVFREDEVKTSLSQEEALKNSPATQKGFFKVTAILDE